MLARDDRGMMGAMRVGSMQMKREVVKIHPFRVVIVLRICFKEDR